MHVLGSAAPGSPTTDADVHARPALRLRRLDGVAFWLGLPWRIARLLREFRPDAVICQTAYEAAAAFCSPAGSHASRRGSSSKCTETGEPRRASTARLRGDSSPALQTASPSPRFAAPTPCARCRRSRVASCATSASSRPASFRRSWTSRRSSVSRCRSPSGRSRSSSACSRPTRTSTALRRRGGSRRRRVPGADAARSSARAPAPTSPKRSCASSGVRGTVELTSDEVAAAARRRVGARAPVAVGGHGKDPRRGVLPRPRSHRDACRLDSRPRRATASSGVLVDPDDPGALADALVRVLSDRGLAERLADGGVVHAAEPWLQTPEQYAQRMRELVA